MRPGALTVLAMVCWGCGGTLAPPSEASPDQVPRAVADPLALEAHVVNLRMWDTRPTDGAPRKPTFWVHADVFSRSEEEVWSLEGARAVIYGRSEEDELITITAGRGRFQEMKRAYLEGDIVARIQDMKLDMADIEWINEERVARTDRPLTLTMEDTHLKASSLRLYPDAKELVMTDVTGFLRLRKETP